MLEIAKEDPTKEGNLDTDVDCTSFESILEFFNQTKLIENSQKKIDEFKNWKKQFDKLIKDSKNHSEMNQFDKKVLEFREQILIYHSENRYDELVKTMIELQKYSTANFTQETDYVSCEEVIRNTVKSIAEDLSQLFEFAYELRKNDLANVYSYQFLSGNVIQQVIIDIIMDNFWDISKKCMILSTKNEYEMTMTIQESKFKLAYVKDT